MIPGELFRRLCAGLLLLSQNLRNLELWPTAGDVTALWMPPNRLALTDAELARFFLANLAKGPAKLRIVWTVFCMVTFEAFQ